MSTPPPAQKRAIALGIKVSFVPTGETKDILEECYFKSIERSAIIIDQEDMTHLMTDSSYREFMSLMRDPGDVTVTACLDPETPIPALPDTSNTVRESIADGKLSISYRHGGVQIPLLTSQANVMEYGGFSAEAGQVIMQPWKFKLTGNPIGGTP